MIDWRFDEADEAAFDAGFDAFIKERKLPLFKKGEWPQERESAIKKDEPQEASHRLLKL